MNFAFFGYDSSIDIARRLIADGHSLTRVFTFSCDNQFSFNRDTLALAGQAGVEPMLSKPRAADIAGLLAQGCALICAGYLYRIPVPARHDPAAVALNLHPALLPKGRGMMPVPHILLDHPEAAGFTVHKLSPEFDAGDIVYSEALPLSPRETVETYAARVAMRTPGVFSRILSNPEPFLKAAKPQDEGAATWFPEPSARMRTLDWGKGVAHIDRVLRAFGGFGSIAMFDRKPWIVFAADVWTEKHALNPGEVVLRTHKEAVIAASDGYVCLKHFEPLQISGV